MMSTPPNDRHAPTATNREAYEISSALTGKLSERAESPLRIAYQHLRKRKIAMICAFVLLAYFLLAFATYLRIPGDMKFIGEWLEDKAAFQHLDPAGDPLDFQPPSLSTTSVEPRGRVTVELIESWAPPSRFDMVLGTDIQGRSVLWRTLYGARLSLTIAVCATLLAIFIGTSLGAIAGYFGGWADVLITWLFTTVASIPRILLILALAYSLKGQEIRLGIEKIPLYFAELPIGFITISLTGTSMLILAMGLTTWVGLCRVIRGEIMKQKSMDYESAARAIGLHPARILVRHLLPNAMYLVIIQASLIFPLFIHLEVILTYLGLGVDEGVSWGEMINSSLLEMIRTPPIWWQLVCATVAIFGISIALNLFGDALRDALDPKLQNRSST